MYIYAFCYIQSTILISVIVSSPSSLSSGVISFRVGLGAVACRDKWMPVYPTSLIGCPPLPIPYLSLNTDFFCWMPALINRSSRYPGSQPPSLPLPPLYSLLPRWKKNYLLTLISKLYQQHHHHISQPSIFGRHCDIQINNSHNNTSYCFFTSVSLSLYVL